MVKQQSKEISNIAIIAHDIRRLFVKNIQHWITYADILH